MYDNVQKFDEDELICGVYTIEDWNSFDPDEQIAIEQAYDYACLHDPFEFD